ncbi:DUF4870 domain-containing protein [Demequina salsinemoris]|uniref:DUF4870 domain-containing protein n=1 Tax=Demequina salsinemoris TaxID=577470 RepID=UPI000AEDD26E|nr:DUF4870 domain-containing protein [Demequina salsinemoris]
MSETPPPPPPTSPTPPPASGSNPNQMASFAHLGVILGFLVPLIIWLVGKDQSPFIDEEGKKALNFGILVSIAYFLSWIPFIGWLLSLAAFVAAIIFGIQGFQAASKGQPYTYPFTIPLVK